MEVSQVKAWERTKPKYNMKQVQYGHDKTLPNIILTSRLVFAGALDRMVCHPEMDVMSGMNAASLFSTSVQWKSPEEYGASSEVSDPSENSTFAAPSGDGTAKKSQ
mmetsp:Transcript_12443/g.25344  ORF Transcript_12443/g.25344 Transcript_12443/m.25344 type:complete len:106 (-) Transcript_12443:1967-2284(-)